MTRLTRFPILLGTVAAFLSVTSMPAAAEAADPTPPECLASNEKAIALRSEHQLAAARSELLVCASSSCPAEVRDECARRVLEVNASMPTIVFEAKDGAGNDLSAVKITMDGRPFVDQLQGTSIPLDPGEHAFVFETAGQPTIRKKILVYEGAKDRHERVTFGHAEPAKEEKQTETGSSAGSTQRLLGWTSVGAGVLGLTVGLIFELQRSSKLSDRDTLCPLVPCDPPGSTQAQKDQARPAFVAQLADLKSAAESDTTIAAVGFIAGGVLAAGGLVLVFTAPSGESHTAFAPMLGPGIQGAMMSHVW